MEKISAARALINGSWEHDVELTIVHGRIFDIQPHTPTSAPKVDLLVPAPVNCHSHAFQRAMAGLTERRGEGRDCFWTWRKLMYRFLDKLDPDQVEAIAAFVQMEMLEAGFGASVEFHYLHHQPNGQSYARLGEMSERIASAATTSGIGLTLLPVHYQFGGCDKRPLGRGQMRFGNDPDRFARLMDDARISMSRLPKDCRLGVAPHSLRAVSAENLAEIISLANGGPVHMHLAEQQAEVDEVLAATGLRPVEWVLRNLDVDGAWCLIHCTQMLPHETEALARTGAVAGLCPLTEASLGDGIFDGVHWLDTGGAIAIGSDSNIRISLAEELRQLETSQRLRDHSRAALATPQRSMGRRLMEDVAAGGARAAGRGSGRIEIGEWADLLAFETTHPDLAGLSPDTTLDCFVASGGNEMVRDVWSAGRHLVSEGRHVQHDSITAAYRAATARLRDGL